MIAAMGWLGSGLVVTSLIQRDINRLRQVNLAASVALVIFNLALGIWSMIVLNIVLAAVNGYHLLMRRLRSGDTRRGGTVEAARGGARATMPRERSATVVERQRAAAGVRPVALVQL